MTGMALVTGGTGAVGNSVIKLLVERGTPVRALVRSREKARRVVPGACELAEGDVTDAASVRQAMAGCATVFHAAGLPEQWLRDAGTFHRVNVGGTRNMVDAALEAKVDRFVYTSTIDVFAAGAGQEFDESVIDSEPKHTAYERSKQAADRVVVDAEQRGLNAVYLHPSAVYGPAPPGSPGLNAFFVRLLNGKMPSLLPGGMPVVFSGDVGMGHVLAADKAAVGSRFILSERYLTLHELAEAVAAQARVAKIPGVLPLRLARLVAIAGEWVAGVIDQPPLIPRGQLEFLQWQARPSSRKAREELGWTPVPFPEGLRLTLEFLRARGQIR